MKRRALMTVACVLLGPAAVAAEIDSARIEQLRQDVVELNRVVREQARRIERLEREIARLRAATPGGQRRQAIPGIDDIDAPWLEGKVWQALRPGMTEAEVIARLGPPTAVRTDDAGVKTLLYTLELEGTGFLSGSVLLADDRVTGIRAPQLR
jgi:outer membrane murein-binding lipoprotein Lpp